MTFYVILFVFLLFCIYCGQVAGMLIHCELSEDLSAVKKYVPMIPFLRIIMFFCCIKYCIRDRNLKFFLYYLFQSEKNFIFLLVLVEILPQLESARRIREVNRKLRETPAMTLRKILFDSQHISEKRYQFM